MKNKIFLGDTRMGERFATAFLISLRHLLWLMFFSHPFVLAHGAQEETLIQDKQAVRLAVSSSLQSSGLVDYLSPHFKQETGLDLDIYAIGSGRALRLAREGSVDAVITHYPEGEKNFMDNGFGISRYALVINDFVLVGPQTDPAGAMESASIGEAFSRIHDQQALFISRGDDSGNHIKERGIWTKQKLEPAGPWYLETGLTMRDTLLYADDRQAYTLCDRGSWLAMASQMTLIKLFEGDDDLKNPYSVIAVNPNTVSGADPEAGRSFYTWITADKAKQLIEEFRIMGERVFSYVGETL